MRTETPLQSLEVGMPLGLYLGPFCFLSTLSPLDSHWTPCLYNACPHWKPDLHIQIPSLFGYQLGILSLTIQNVSSPKTCLSHNFLSKWYLHPSSCSVQNPWTHTWLFHFSYVLCPVYITLLHLPWKHDLNLMTTSITVRIKPTSSLAWICTKAFWLISLLCPCIPTDLVTSLLKPLQWLLTSSE